MLNNLRRRLTHAWPPQNRLLLMLLAAGMILTMQTVAENGQGSGSKAPGIGLIEVSGTINPGSASYIGTSIEHAQEKGLQALIVKLDTPGGLLSSTRDIVRYISTADIPVIMYVAPGGARATSAGAIISVASHLVAMEPGTNIGAATPVASGGKDIEGDMGAKAKNDTAAMIRGQAKQRGRNEKAAEELVTEAKSLSAEEAVKQKLAELLVDNMSQLLEKLDGREIRLHGDRKLTLETSHLSATTLTRIPMTHSQQFLHLVANPNISTLLMALGGMAIYAEVSSGFSLIIPGTIGIILLLLGFVSLQMLPINVGGALLLLLGLVLIAAESRVASFGVLSISGMVALGIGAMFLVDTSQADMQVSMGLLLPILAALGIISAIVSIMFAREKRMRKNFDPVDGAEAEVREVNEDGRSGKAFVQGETWNFVSDEPMKVKEKAVVVGYQGLRLQLRRKD